MIFGAALIIVAGHGFVGCSSKLLCAGPGLSGFYIEYAIFITQQINFRVVDGYRSQRYSLLGPAKLSVGELNFGQLQNLLIFAGKIETGAVGKTAYSNICEGQIKILDTGFNLPAVCFIDFVIQFEIRRAIDKLRSSKMTVGMATVESLMICLRYTLFRNNRHFTSHYKNF